MSGRQRWEVETTRALERHARGEARVVPVIVRACDWQSAPFAELQAMPKDGEPVTEWGSRDKAWLAVTQGLRGALAEPSPPEDVLRVWLDRVARSHRTLMPYFERRGAVACRAAADSKPTCEEPHGP